MSSDLTYLLLLKHYQRENFPSSCDKSFKSSPNVSGETITHALVLTNNLTSMSSDEQRQFDVK